MRKIFVMVMLTISTLVFASTAENYLGQAAAAFQISNQTAAGIDLHFQLPAFEIETAALGTASYQRIKLPQAEKLPTEGMPELPFMSTTIAIPARGKVAIQVLSSSQRTLDNYVAYPLQEDIDSSTAAVRMNSEYYRSGGIYPEAALRYSDPQILRDLRIVTIQVNPFAYDATTKQLIIRDNIELRISCSDGEGINELSSEALQISPTFASMYEANILNFDDYRGAMLANVPPRILIIYGNSTDANYLNSINSFALWKRQKGAEVLMASTASNQAGNTTTSIKNYIQTKYNDLSTRPDYVILIGDVSGSFPIPAFTVSGGGGDYPYTHLSGNDLLGDCFIGRISAETIEQLNIILHKIYLYERDINISTANWLDNMLLVGDWDPSGISTVYISKYIKEMSNHDNPDYHYTEIYGAAPAPASMNTAINAGIGFFSFRGYWGMSGWDPSPSLVNTYKLPHAVIITCATGNYATDIGTTESFIRLGSEAVPAGAVTAIGMSTSSTHTTFNNVLHGGIFDGIFAYDMRTMGEAMLHGKLYMNDIFGVSAPNSVRDFTHWCNLMGDPTMEVFISVPDTYIVTTPSQLPIGSSLLDVRVTNSGGTALAGQCVTLSLDSVILGRAYTDEYGLATIELPDALTAGTGKITVSGHNFKPTQRDITISVGGIITEALNINDDNSGASQGNGDGLANAGEVLELSFAIRNTNNSTLRSVSGILSSSNPYVNITGANVYYGDIPAGMAATNASPAIVTISAACPDQVNLHFILSLTDTGGRNYSVSEHILVYNGRMEVYQQLVIDDQDNVLDPDESAQLRIGVLNTGASALSGLSGTLSSSSSFVIMNNATAYYGDAAPGTLLLPSSNFGVYINALCLPGMVLPFELELTNAQGYLQTLYLNFTVGSVSITDPLGPDEYGYVIYDIGDVAFDDCPEYVWYGIAPAEGGPGTALAITDTYYGGEEGDQVGADALEEISLPFTFRYYGLPYNRITVCSNGFIALGSTANAEFRNFRLPGAMGPSPMIAPFWDDLATGTNSGIYKYYDVANHRFIIEWYRMLNGYNGSSEETFQLILYNQTYMETSTGDGPILIHYQTFNNVDAQSGTEHGNFATIGIENHTGTIGLEYSFNNQYPTAAAPLTHLRSLYITTLPEIVPGPNLTISSVQHYDTNENGHLEPGEMDYMTLFVRNIGDANASNIQASLMCTDPYVTIINDSAAYGTLAPLASSAGNAYFQFQVSAACPQDHALEFVLNISANEGSWTKDFTVTVHQPVLLYQSWYYDDFALNQNGVPDPGETGTIMINLLNETDVDMEDAILSLSESSPYLSFSPSQIECGDVAGGAIFQASTMMPISASAPVGTAIPISAQIISSNAATQSFSFTIIVGITNYSWDFEANNGGFTYVNSSTPGWEWGVSSYAGAASGTKVWGTVLNGNHASNSTYQLISPAVHINNTTQLNFKHRYHAERTGTSTYWDGGQVEISTNNGASWSLIHPVGGYPISSIVALGYEPGYGGEQLSWLDAAFDLSSYSGQNCKIRWLYASDISVNFEGWFIDDVSFISTSSMENIGKVSGMVSIAAPTRDMEGVQIHLGEYYLLPDDTGSYSALIPEGSYQARGEKAGYRSTPVAVNLAAGSQITGINLSLEYLPCPENISWMISGSTLNLRWTPVSDGRLSAYRIYSKASIGNWVLVSSTLGNSCSLPISSTGILQYKVQAYYNDGWESLASTILSFSYPYNGTDVQPQSVAGINVLNQNGMRRISWMPVTQDTEGNPISVWEYRVYAGTTPDFDCVPANLIGSTTELEYLDSTSYSRRFYLVKALLGYADSTSRGYLKQD